MYETFEHTADLGLRIRSADRNALFEEAARGLFSIIVEDLETVRPERSVEIILPADTDDYLLFDWLNGLLYHFDSEHVLFARFEVTVGDQGLTGKAWGEPLDRQRHRLEHEVKAITYHGLKVENSDDNWLAEVIVDI